MTKQHPQTHGTPVLSPLSNEAGVVQNPDTDPKVRIERLAHDLRVTAGELWECLLNPETSDHVREEETEIMIALSVLSSLAEELREMRTKKITTRFIRNLRVLAEER